MNETNQDSQSNLIDATYMTAAELLAEFERLVADGYVLRGVNCREDELEHISHPRTGRDVYRDSGRRHGVYATDIAINVFAFALFDAREVRKYYDDFAITTTRMGDVQYIGFEDLEVYEFVKQHRHKVFTNGFILVFDGTPFQSADDAPHELVAQETQHPVAIYKIGAHVADELFQIDGKHPTVLLEGDLPTERN